MTLFKIARGRRDNLPIEMKDGCAYFCTDTGEIFIDYADNENNLHRKQISADEAKTLSGMTVDEIITSAKNEVVLYTEQELTDEQKAQVKTNIGIEDSPPEVVISDTEPTDENATIWINTSEEWNDNIPDIPDIPEISTDDEIIEMIIQEDMLPVVTDSDGAFLSDENGNILLW